ncbi:BIRC2 [Branchiostoma lanceolatum]|uniref:BIRC2 protein n=1 Tax=Branchiostoma lanceolatum TaxID=7740 RepID=A0A8J9Z2B9_BRALA|nr:BIRC2 [Branchiostoma lanceolatum]
MAHGYDSSDSDLTSDHADSIHCSVVETESGYKPNHSNYFSRMATYSLFVALPLYLSSFKLAEAGFFYPGDGIYLQCFSCNGNVNVNTWKEGEDPLRKHFELFPHCKYAREKVEKLPPENSCRQGGFDSCTGHSPLISDVPDKFHRSKVNQEAKGHVFIDDFHKDKAEPKHAKRHQFIQTPSPTGHVVDIRTCDHRCRKDLNTEIHRLHTYYSYGWPLATPVTPEVLAAECFFYLGVRDKVECAFCGGVLHQWERGDDPRVEHERHYGHCPYVRGMATSNIPIGETTGQSAKETVYFTAKPTFISYGHTESQVQPSVRAAAGPKHPELASEDSRMSTFFRWPLYSPISPRRLAKAGFFYTYIDDQVKCFWCDGGLKDWQSSDDPWTEHARWYGQECGFVQQEKGIAYISDVKKHCSTVVEKHEHHMGGPSIIEVKEGNHLPREQGSELETAMESRVVRDAAGMGFERHSIETVVGQRLRSVGQPFTTLTSLVEVLLAVEDGGKEGGSKEQPSNNTTEEVEPTVQLAPVECNESPHAIQDETPTSKDALQRKLRELEEERLCKICLYRNSNVVLIPCGHFCCCVECANAMCRRKQSCPICRKRVQKIQKTFLA